MSTIGKKYPNLQDHASRLDPQGRVDKIVEILNEDNPILGDMAMSEGNLPTGHKHTIRTGLPTATWRRLYEGVQSGKSKTAQVTDSCGILAEMAEIDKKVVELNGNNAEFLLSESRAALEAIGQAFSSTFFYGNTATDPEKFMGLAPRFDSLSAENATNIINCAGSGADNTSVWLTTWGESTLFGIYPKGAKAGIWDKQEKDIMLEDAAGGKYPGYRTYYEWMIGLCLRDWRYVVRMANIDISDLTADASTGANLIQNMIRAIHKIPNMGKGKGKQIFYVNETIATFLDLQTLSQNNLNISYGKDEHGERVLTFRGIPVKQCDALLETEAVVS